MKFLETCTRTTQNKRKIISKDEKVDISFYVGTWQNGRRERSLGLHKQCF